MTDPASPAAVTTEGQKQMSELTDLEDYREQQAALSAPAAVTEERIAEIRDWKCQCHCGQQKFEVLAALDARGLELARVRRDWIKNAEELRKFAEDDAETARRAFEDQRACFEAMREDRDKFRDLALAAQARLAQANEALKTTRNAALEEAAHLVESIVVSGPEDDEIDHDDYRDSQIAAAVRALIRTPIHAAISTSPTQVCVAPFPNECCATEEQCLGRAGDFTLCTLRPTPPAQSAGEALDPAGTGEGETFTPEGVAAFLAKHRTRIETVSDALDALSQLEEAVGIIRAQASALAEARRSALEEAAALCKASVVHNFSPNLSQYVIFPSVIDRIRALTEPQHGNG